MFNTKIKYIKLTIVIISAISTLAISSVFISKGIHVIYQNIFYIPILLSCFWFGKKGLIYSEVILLIHILIFMNYRQSPFWGELIRVVVISIIGFITYKLADNIRIHKLKILSLDRKLKNDVDRFNRAEMLSHLGSYEVNLKTGKNVWSNELFRIFGFQPDSFKPTQEKILELTHPSDRNFVEKSIYKAIRENGSFEIENRIIRPDGTIRWVVSTGYIENDEKGEASSYIGSLLDITERKLLEKSLYEEKEKLQITISSIGDGIISTDTDGYITILNKVAEELTGWTEEEALGMPMENVFHIINKNTKAKLHNPLKKVMEQGKASELDNNTVLISKDGLERSIADSAAPIIDNEQNIKGAILVFRDVTEEKQRHNEIYYLSYHDSLTGLYNRRFFEEEIKRLDTERNLPISIIMGDANGLKLTNDAFGHSIGDKLLKKVAEAIKSSCRTDDIAARWGGDEFTILLPKTNEDDAKIIVDRIKKTCSTLKVNGINVSISFGFDTKKKVNHDISLVLKSAEEYMYKNKAAESKYMVSSIINTILNTLYENNPKHEDHSLRVSNYCISIGKALNLSEIEINKLKTSSLLHDIGKIAPDKTIINESGNITDKEINDIKKHTEVGYRILGSSPENIDIAQYVLYHHERYDGLGHPRGLKQEEIPFLSRIIAVADSYDNMTNGLSYEKVLNKNMAIENLTKNKGTLFDPYIVDVFIENILLNVYDYI